MAPSPGLLLSAGIVPVRRLDDGWRFLVLRFYRNWDFPKGRVEPGETPLEAAIRETAEEASLTDLRFPWGHDFSETAPYSSPKKLARYFLAETQTETIFLPVNPDLGHPEHHEGRWASAEQAAALLPARLQPVLAWARAAMGPQRT